MNAERLLAHYEQIADAPDAIARLRRFILDLAVRGKLVAQDASDEPASELQARLAATYSFDKVDLGRRGKRPVIAAGLVEEPPYELPSNWVWARMGGLGDTNIGLTYSPADVGDGGYPVLRSNNIQEGRINLSGLVRVRTLPKSSVMVQQGDMLICARNGSRTLVGKAAFIEKLPESMAFGAFMAIFRSPINRYLHLFVSSPVFRQVIDEVSTTTINQITQANLRSTLVPLPPLAEQHRIVAKVDELMGLCDRLEGARESREAVRDRLAAASLARLNAPDPESFLADARFALDVLPALTTRLDQIKQLRQTILNLAVRGKLVPQDPNDEPASELLKRIGKEKAKHSGKSRSLPAIEEAERPFILPSGWLHTRVGDVFSIRTGFAFKSSTYAQKGTLVFRVTNFDRDGGFDFSDVVYFPTEKIDSRLSNFLLLPGEIIMVMVGGTIGKTTIVDEKILPALLNQNMWRIRSFGALMSNRFEYLLVKAINQSIQGLTHSTHGHFAMGDYELKVIALPPLAEQHRIVAKVDELMALCDRLEASLTAATDTRRRLLDALLAEALAPAEERELEAAE